MSGQAHALAAQAAQPAIDRAPRMLQRQCDCGQHTFAGMTCDACGGRRATGTAGVPPIVGDVLRTSGESMRPRVRRDMERRFRRDFSAVRVHADARAAESARAVDALAYTVGRHIVFDTGRYEPEQPAGRALLAHELTHTLQPDTPGPLRIGAPGSAAEAEANRVARLVVGSDIGAIAAPGSSDGAPHLLRRLTGGDIAGIVIGAVAGAAAIAGLIAALVGRGRRLMHWETNAPDVALVDDPTNSPPTSTILLPQNTRVVIVDEGVGRSFNVHEPHWVMVRVTVGPFLNRVGWVHRNQLESRPETEEIAPEQANEIFTALSQASMPTTEGQAPIPFHYPPDGCYARAHRMEELLTEMGYASRKVFALAGRRPLRAASPYAQDAPPAGQPDAPPEVVWVWHVAPIITVRDPVRGLVETVVDPSLADHPISLTDWEGLMGDSRTFTRLSLDQLQRTMRSAYDRAVVVTGRYSYGVEDVDPDEETREQAEAEDRSRRATMTEYVHRVPVHELAALVRRQLARAVIDVAAIVAALRRATAEVLHRFKVRFANLLARLRARLSSDEASQIDSALGP